MDFGISNLAEHRSKGVASIWYAERSEFDAIAQLPASPADLAAEVTIADTHTFLTTHGFRQIFVDTKKTRITSTPTGGEYSQGSEVKLATFIPGNAKELVAMLKRRPDLILIVENPGCEGNGQDPIQLGTNCNKVTIATADFDSQTTETGGDDPGWTVEFSCVTAAPLVFYAGTITPAP